MRPIHAALKRVRNSEFARSKMSAEPEVRFARKLASNDARTRNKAVKALRRWMTARSQVEDGFTELELLKVWKGLYMCMWHSDKPLVQEELAETIAGFVHILEQSQLALLFLRTFFTTISREWHGIDRLRLDKFYMLIRRVVKHSFQFLKTHAWDRSLVQAVAEMYESCPLSPVAGQASAGVQLHVVEVYLPELLSTGGKEIPGDCTMVLLGPCWRLLAKTQSVTVAETVARDIFEAITLGKKADRLKGDLGALSQELLQVAIDRGTLGRNRKTLYHLRRRLADSAALKEGSTPEENVEVPPAKRRAKERLQGKVQS